MVRELINVQVGQCGNQIGCAFWQAIAAEHALNLGTENENQAGVFMPELAHDEDGVGGFDELEKIDVFFRLVDPTKPQETRHVPRAVIVDLEPGTIDVIKSSPLGHMFRSDNFVFGANGAGNNWAKGHYTEGAELVDDVLDRVRREMEDGDCVQGVQLTHSVGGGTGSGMGTLLLLKIRDAYPDKITTTYSVYPSPKVSDTVVEPYNAVLSSHQLLENSDETFLIDNEALFNIASEKFKLPHPNMTQLNNIVAQSMCGITASLRFPGKLNSDLRKLGVNLVPFPRLHFFLISQAPLSNDEKSQHQVLNVKSITTEVWKPSNFLSNVRPTDGKFLATNIIYRGPVSSEEVDHWTEQYQTKHQDDFVEWIPNNIKTSIVITPPQTSNMSATFLANTTALKGIFQRLSTQFAAMYRRKAFLHWYKNEGMDEMEFQEADKNVKDLITEYQDKQDAVYEEDEDEESEDESI